MWSLFSRTSSFPYEILDIVSDDKKTIWRLHKGKKKENGEEVSIFVCDEESSVVLDLAKGAVKRLKMLKHPSILKFIDSMESEKSVYLVTEVVSPLLLWLSQSEKQVTKSSLSEGLAGWGLLQITEGLNFIINSAKLAHNNINCYSVYVTQGGEWKIFGLEYASADYHHYPIKVLPHLSVYKPPEFERTDNIKPPTQIWSTDVWSLGSLIWEVFNIKPLSITVTMNTTSLVPKSLLSTYVELLAANPMKRPDPAQVIEKLKKPGQFFHNDLIVTLTFIDEIHIKDDAEKHRFFSNLSSKLDNIPDFISKNKILPALLTAHEFSNLGSVLLTPIFKIGHILEDSEYQSQIVPCVVKMFTSTDRATRLKLLQQIEFLADHLDSKTVNDQIFQPLVTGFQDTNPTIREFTVKAVLFLAPKMNYNNLNVEVLKHFARLQSRDDQGGIRTNTTVCLGKIASCLHPDTRQKCLVSAFTRAMRDPFPPARVAGVTALGATQQFYPLSDASSKILPALSQLTLDPEKNVRDAVFRVLKGFLGKLEKVSEDPTLREVMEKEVATASTSSSPSSWAGWAVGVASKFYKGPLAQTRPPQESSTNSNEQSSTTTDSRPKNDIASSDSRKEASKSNYSDKRNTNQESYLKTESVSKILESVSVSDDAGEGWGVDEEDWGSLEMMDNNSQNTESMDQAISVNSTANYSWRKSTSGNDDFFSSFDKPSGTSSNFTKPKSKSPTAAGAKNSWDAWEEDADLKEIDIKEPEFEPSQDTRKSREEKKLQRQKEIEAKRAARSGPMKLGTRKPF